MLHQLIEAKYKQWNETNDACGYSKLPIDYTDMSFLFSESSETCIDVSSFDTSNVTSMYYLFNSCKSLTHLDLSHFDTSKVTNMICMFSDCLALTYLNVAGWNTSHVRNMAYMFYDCHSLEYIDLTGWDTSHVEDMSHMFKGCTSLKRIDVAGWDTLNVTDMSRMFFECTCLVDIDVAGWDTLNVTDMSCMFGNCKSLQKFVAPNWNIQNVRNMNDMFYGCESLQYADLSEWDISDCNSVEKMFAGCHNLTALYMKQFDPTNVWCEHMFQDCRLSWRLSHSDMVVNIEHPRSEFIKVMNDIAIYIYRHIQELFTLLRNDLVNAELAYKNNDWDKYRDCTNSFVDQLVNYIQKHTNIDINDRYLPSNRFDEYIRFGWISLRDEFDTIVNQCILENRDD